MPQSTASHSSGSWKAIALCIVLLSALAMVACEAEVFAPQTARITGRLTLDGRALGPDHAVVFMQPLRGDLAFGLTDVHGRFEVNSWKKGEMPPGTYQAYIRPPAGREDDSHHSFDTSPRNDAKPLLLDFPRRFIDKDTSGLEFKVLPGMNDFDVLMTSEDPSAT